MRTAPATPAMRLARPRRLADVRSISFVPTAPVPTTRPFESAPDAFHAGTPRQARRGCARSARASVCGRCRRSHPRRTRPGARRCRPSGAWREYMVRARSAPDGARARRSRRTSGGVRRAARWPPRPRVLSRRQFGHTEQDRRETARCRSTEPRLRADPLRCSLRPNNCPESSARGPNPVRAHRTSARIAVRPGGIWPVRGHEERPRVTTPPGERCHWARPLPASNEQRRKSLGRRRTFIQTPYADYDSRRDAPPPQHPDPGRRARRSE